MDAETPIDVYLLALPESAGSPLYGMIEVLASTGPSWRELSGLDRGPTLIRTHIVGLTRERFTLTHGIPVQPDLAIGDLACPEILIIPDLWLAPDDAMTDRYDELKAWLRH